MTYSEDDEELNRAIAMSLEDADAHIRDRPVSQSLEQASDENGEDEDLRRVIAMSLQEIEGAGASAATLPQGCALPSSSSHIAFVSGQSKDAHPAQQRIVANAPNSTDNRPTTSLLGLDRKAMERERLARLGKRRRTASPEMPMQRVDTSVPTEVDSNEGKRSRITKESDIEYPQGTIKRTWAFKHPRTKDIKIEELFQGSTLNIAVLSSFQWDDLWLFSKIPPTKIKQVWIMSAKGKDLQDELRTQAKEAKIPNHKTHFPPMDGQTQHMHSKLMLLFHETHLRVVVPTANMIKFDWGETNQDPTTGKSWQAAVMENSVFLIDLPRRRDGGIGRKADLPLFGKELLTFLEAQDVGSNIVEGVLKFEFSDTGHIGFVHSIPGSLTQAYAERTGLRGLASAIRVLGLDHVVDLELDYAAASLGAIKAPFLQQLYLAACGSHSLSSNGAPSDSVEHIRIYFPVHDTVVKSTGGADCGGIITLRRAHFNADFPKQCMRDHESTRPGLLSHNKILLARGRKKDGMPVAWAYVGSANLSESAWGTQKTLKSGKEGKPSIRNWECGVVVPVPAEAMKGLDLKEGEVPPMSVFEGTVEVPFQYPGREYGSMEPWFFSD